MWRVALGSVTPRVVGCVPAPTATTACSPSGPAFGTDGALFIAEGDKVCSVRPDAAAPAQATVFAGGLPGPAQLPVANGITFEGLEGPDGIGPDRAGDMWVPADNATPSWWWRPAAAVPARAR